MLIPRTLIVLSLLTLLSFSSCSTNESGPALEDILHDYGSEAGPQEVLGDTSPAPDSTSQVDVPGSDDLPGDPGPVCDQFGTVGHFEASMSVGGGSLKGAYMNGPQPLLLDKLAEAGDCAFYGLEQPRLCDPPCPPEQACGFGNECREFPHSVDIGTVSFEGTTPGVTLEQQDFYHFTHEPFPQLFGPGDPIQMHASGGADVKAFSLSAEGVALMVMDEANLTMTQGQPFVVSWEPSPAAASFVRVHLDIDHHANVAAYVECIAPDAQGQVEIPAELVDLLIESGHSGIGTYVENAYVERFNSDILPFTYGCVELRILSKDWIFVDTVLN